MRQSISIESRKRILDGRRGERLRSLVAKGAAGCAAFAALTAPFLLAPSASAHPGSVKGAVAACTSMQRELQASRTSAYKPAPRFYDEAIGDSGNAPDFCAQEIVTNDNHTITIGIHAHNRSGFEPGDVYTIFLDTDLNGATGGDGAGAEYAITFSGAMAGLERWNGSTFDQASSVPVDWVDGYGPVLTFDRAAIGDAARFNFVLISANGEDGDRAPDAGSWSFTLTPFALEATKLSLGPARAGHRFIARTLVLRSDFDGPLTEGAIACTATLAGHALSGSGRFANDRVLCSWNLPKKSRGSRLTGKLAVTYQGVQAHKTFSVTVR